MSNILDPYTNRPYVKILTSQKYFSTSIMNNGLLESFHLPGHYTDNEFLSA